MAEGIDTGSGTQLLAARGGSSVFRWPEMVPWSELGPDFIETWGHKDDGTLAAEHLEVAGQSGSGKSYTIATLLQQRAERWGTAEIAILTKEADDSIPLLGWPVVGSYADLKRYRWAIYWPQTAKLGEEREKFLEAHIYDLLSRLWTKDANVVIYFDEIGTAEELSKRLKKLIRQYWREGRSHQISVIAAKQRPIGISRDAHSESRWKIVFPPADTGDMQRFAELLGHPRDWAPVLDSLDQQEHQFVIRNSFTKQCYISWVDLDLMPLPAQSEQGQRRSSSDALYGRRPRAA
jgi:nucleoside-triphosphatase THEP1